VSINNNIFNKHRVTRLASLFLGIAVLLSSGVVFGQVPYEGAEFCKDCHEANYNDWKASGHPYKLMKGQQAQHRSIPLPLGRDWPDSDELDMDDVSYVIGGYKWKSRYIDNEGYIITTTCEENPPLVEGCTEVPGINQYNYLTGKWSSYHPGEEKKPYTCGTCHTTNWVPDTDAETDNDLSDNQDGLPGMWGTFDDGGIHCEQCHGNGMTMEVDDSAAACGACHYREADPDAAVNVIPASGGFIKHHEQYNEHLAGSHSNWKCTSCHDPHKRGEYSIKEGRECTSCHSGIAATYEETSMYDYNVECKDCHMPFATKSAQATGPHAGDLQTHIFYINTDADGKLFTEDGKYVALDDDGKAAVTMDFACQRCHETTELAELSRFAKNFHGLEMNDQDELLDPLHYVGFNPGLSGHWWGGASRSGEGFLLDVAYSGDTLTVVASFYTYDSAGNQVWLIASGAASSGTTSSVSVTITDGPAWGEDFDPALVNRTPWGTAEFTFPSCTGGTVILMPNADMQLLGYTDFGYDLQRDDDLITSGITCPIMENNPN